MDDWKNIVINGKEVTTYMINTKGDVKSLDRYIVVKNRYGGTNKRFAKGKIIQHSKNNRGYHIVHIYVHGKSKSFLVSRLVAQTFIPNPNNYPEVDHIDENKNNNCVDNLRWCTRQFNNTRGIQSREGREKTSEFRMKKIGMYDKNGNLLKIYKGIRIAERDTNINNRNIVSCCKANFIEKGRMKNNHTCGGYIWRYL